MTRKAEQEQGQGTEEEVATTPKLNKETVKDLEATRDTDVVKGGKRFLTKSNLPEC